MVLGEFTVTLRGVSCRQGGQEVGGEQLRVWRLQSRVLQLYRRGRWFQLQSERSVENAKTAMRKSTFLESHL